MALEQADRLSNHARWLISGKGDGIQVYVHVGGFVGVVVGMKCGGEDRNRRLVVELAKELVMVPEGEVLSFVLGAESNWRSRCASWSVRLTEGVGAERLNLNLKTVRATAWSAFLRSDLRYRKAIVMF